MLGKLFRLDKSKRLNGSTKIETPFRFVISTTDDGLIFSLPSDQMEKVINRQCDNVTLNRFIVLKMLTEEGLAFFDRDSFRIDCEDAVRLDDNTRSILGLPSPWTGSFRVSIKNQSQKPNFEINIFPVLPNGEIISFFSIEGPFLKISEEEIYMPNSSQWQALKAVSNHKKLNDSERCEYQNLLAIYNLQQASKQGADIDLSHFKNLQVVLPKNVAVSIDKQNDGSLKLIPNYGGIGSPEEIYQRLGQLSPDGKVQSLRVKDSFILLDEKKLAATQEIIRNRRIPIKQAKQFIETPGAFLDAELINLDIGFSMRVKGATAFKHGYFGDTSLSDIAWFSKEESENKILPDEHKSPTELIHELIPDLNALHQFEARMNDAIASGSQSFDFQNSEISLSNADEINSTLSVIKQTIQDQAENILQIESEVKVLDIRTNDEFCDFGTMDVPENTDSCMYPDTLSFEDYKRQPFPHQRDGIRWILGLSKEAINAPPEMQDRLGALLADDMGLGKTYMSLVSICEFYKLAEAANDIQRPVLVVSPLSLLENWKNEVQATFEKNPFRDVIILQSNAELSKFKVKGGSIETRQAKNNENQDDTCMDTIRYALKIGPEFGNERLDTERRLVLVTYQTLRDYQFSLCRVDWSFVIFDEAQNIKNPNTLQTRTAKALKAKFKLMVTGTPVENHLGDFWCLFDTARPGVLGAYQEFLKVFVLPLLRATPDIIREKREQIGYKLRKSVGGLMLRRTKEEKLKGLPEKRIYVGADIEEGRREIFDPQLVCVMTGRQLQVYKSIINETIADMNRPELYSGSVLRGLHQLRDVSLHPSLIDSGMLPIPETTSQTIAMINDSVKLKKAIELLNEIKTKQEKAIIFVLNKRLQQFLTIILHRLYGIKAEIINGDTKAVAKRDSAMTRVKIIDIFQSGSGFNILIMSPVAAGVGLTVTGANNVIHLERHWNPAKEDQATDRVYRIGQTKDVNVYIPIVHHPTERSFEVNLNRLLMSKTDLKDAIVTQEEVTSSEMVKTGLFGKYL